MKQGNRCAAIINDGLLKKQKKETMDHKQNELRIDKRCFLGWLQERQPMVPARSQHGFTLIEVTMAMVILGVGIMSIVALQTRDSMYNNSSRRQTQAYTWAMDRVERLRALSYGDADLTVAAAPRTATQAPYTVRWTVTDNTANVADTKKVDVDVLWNNSAISNVTFTKTKSSL